MYSGPDDVARFLMADSEELVTAAFACPTCLCSAAEVHLGAEEDDVLADCVCTPCERRWTVALDGFQAMRLALAPPSALSMT